MNSRNWWRIPFFFKSLSLLELMMTSMTLAGAVLHEHFWLQTKVCWWLLLIIAELPYVSPELVVLRSEWSLLAPLAETVEHQWRHLALFIRSVNFLECLAVEKTGVLVSLFLIKENWIMNFGVKCLDNIWPLLVVMTFIVTTVITSSRSRHLNKNKFK